MCSPKITLKSNSLKSERFRIRLKETVEEVKLLKRGENEEKGRLGEQLKRFS